MGGVRALTAGGRNALRMPAWKELNVPCETGMTTAVPDTDSDLGRAGGLGGAFRPRGIGGVGQRTSLPELGEHRGFAGESCGHSWAQAALGDLVAVGVAWGGGAPQNSRTREGKGSLCEPSLAPEPSGPSGLERRTDGQTAPGLRVAGGGGGR